MNLVSQKYHNFTLDNLRYFGQTSGLTGWIRPGGCGTQFIYLDLKGLNPLWNHDNVLSNIDRVFSVVCPPKCWGKLRLKRDAQVSL